ncbi:hypothetical protein cypCar_00045636 [Cyprinus carpio]|nr:hypothetical protein cypCar_00045636 [Cyprinus carpio]
MEAETEDPAPSLEDVNLTAYKTWKLKHQKKYGGEENKNSGDESGQEPGHDQEKTATRGASGVHKENP